MASFCDRGYLRQFASQCEAALAVARFDRCIGEVTDGAPCYAEQTCSTLEITVNSIKILIILTEHPAMQTCSTTMEYPPDLKFVATVATGGRVKFLSAV